jgi:hypothetical protein
MEQDIKSIIEKTALKYSNALRIATNKRIEEDDTTHFLIYRVLGVSDEEGKLIDVYQNKGRFLYKYAGAFLEETAKICFTYKFPNCGAIRIPNTEGRNPKTFEIDCLVGQNALEIKWRDATTDGDHITKEHTRIRVIKNAGYIPIRVMFYYPNRNQAIRIQKTLETLYRGIGGEYYFGDEAWKYVLDQTGINLYQMLEDIASEKPGQ